ncbi:cytoskeletal protein RodZ [Vagococcus fluvialis]|uniref:helix-turn-helix domain-containing protein n=1 Tax=Vagococcus fluvialis TaxID=2738 RepID=UPI000E07266F|nr:helix-turn-helix domain-containing protein [Vagococcus fluvialis]MBO0436630.1 helix-turn-helix domain-containing protein [Vagococcus fluvialis]MBO0479936.1 helix-turn-helix domain-containing protein [Vagococcus fluvialis]MBO0486909.1 helix-turn-helix domain-containing protein [Vagococcus fluvialis]NKC59218.1 helix-turn-helix domain-containing protein [Vagococcus fluvialis]NKD49974.1 helix-turn-helix domain-containing protein [Vagococcus fluvialis]
METIGEKLQKARIDRGLTIGDLQKITKIQRRYLEAIEENDFDAMPSDYYKRTFIRQFAEAVGLNPRPLLRRLDGKPEEEELTNTMALSMPVKGSRKSKYNETNTKKSLIASYIPVALLVLVVAAIIGTIVWAIMLDSEKGPIVPTPNKTTIVDSGSKLETSTTTEKSETEESTKDSEKTEEKKKETNISLVSDDGETVVYKLANWEKPMKVAFKGLDNAAWVGLQNSQTQEIFYQYTIQPKEELETFVPDELDSFSIVVGASRNVTIFINGEEIKFNEKTPVDGKKMITLEKGTTTTEKKEDEN